MFDENVEHQEKRILRVLQNYDSCHQERLNQIMQCQETEIELKASQRENEKIKMEVDKLTAETSRLKEKIISLVGAWDR